MPRTNSLVNGMLQRCNEIRVAFGATPLDQLPRGHMGQSADCSGHRALRGLKLRQFKVGEKTLMVNAQFADIIARTWGTAVIEVEPAPAGYVHVMLPPAMKRFIKVFDAGDLPQVTVRPRTKALIAAAS